MQGLSYRDPLTHRYQIYSYMILILLVWGVLGFGIEKNILNHFVYLLFFVKQLVGFSNFPTSFENKPNEIKWCI